MPPKFLAMLYLVHNIVNKVMYIWNNNCSNLKHHIGDIKFNIASHSYEQCYLILLCSSYIQRQIINLYIKYLVHAFIYRHVA